MAEAAHQLRLQRVIDRSAGVVEDGDAGVAEHAVRPQRGASGVAAARVDEVQAIRDAVSVSIAGRHLVHIVGMKQIEALAADVADFEPRVAQDLMLGSRIPLPVVTHLS